MPPSIRPFIARLLHYSIPFNWVIHAFQRTVFELRHVFLAVGLLHALLNHGIIKDFFKSTIIRVYMLFIAAILLSAITTNTGWEGLFEMTVWLLYMLAAFAAAHIDRDAMVKTFILTPIALAILYLGVQGYSFFFGLIQGVNDGSRLHLFMYTSSRLGFISSLSILYLIARYSQEIEFRNKAAVFALLFLNAVILYQSYSRSSILSCLILSAAMVLLIYRNSRMVKLAFVSVAALFLVYFAIDDSGMIQRFTVLLDNPLKDRDISARVTIWYVAWKTFLAHPVFGINFSHFETTYREFLAANPAIFEQFSVVNPSHTHAHNLVLELLAGSGVTGCVTFFTFFLLLLKKSWDNKSLRIIMVPFLLAFLLHGLTSAMITRWLYLTFFAPFIGALVYDEMHKNTD